MGRPSLEQRVRDAVRDYLSAAVARSADDSPLNTLAVATRLGFDRKTLKKYRLDKEIAAAAQRQSGNGQTSRRKAERKAISEKLRQRDDEIDALRHRCEALIAQVCLAEGNAQRLAIDPAELWKPLVIPDRCLPHTIGHKGRNRRN
jgi:hypothetical protein